eukprot:TRINITY_DN2002_c0_g1_i1.p3 TRINITY_DN2002_c0_g1~~TRINITY_DN2002_c0_g1_i1.p3  ORF type:complete len:121 (-),score=17.02 TRINITY_DN2002_c0_g1_i1:152-514(-)
MRCTRQLDSLFDAETTHTQIPCIILSVTFFFFNDTATTEIYTRSIVGSVRCVQETGDGVQQKLIVMLKEMKFNIMEEWQCSQNLNQLTKSGQKVGCYFLLFRKCVRKAGFREQTEVALKT